MGEETLRLRVLRWILLVSNTVSLICCIIVVIGGKWLVDYFKEVPKHTDNTYIDAMIRVFSAIEAIIIIIGLFGIIKRHFVVFATHTVLLILYFVIVLIFTRVLVIWFWLLAVVLVVLTITFLYFVYEYRKEYIPPSRNI